MVDIFTKEKRSQVMSKIRSRSGLEDRFCKMLSSKVYPLGFRYRRNYKKLPGSPDIAFPRKKIAIFIDGSFWHGYGVETKLKKSPPSFWREKILGNIRRDRKNHAVLRRRGWTVLRIWEHEFEKTPDICINKTIGTVFR